MSFKKSPTKEVSLEDGRVRLFKRLDDDGKELPHWYAYIKLGKGLKAKRVSTGQRSLERAKTWASKEAFKREARHEHGLDQDEISFEKAAKSYLKELEIELTRRRQGGDKLRYQTYVVNTYLIPHFAGKKLHQVNAQRISRYINERGGMNRVTAHKKEGEKVTLDTGRLIRPTTINKENVALRGIFKHAVKMGWLSQAPKVSNEPRKLEPRAHFTRAEWLKLKPFLAKWHLEIRGSDSTLQRYYRQALSDFCQLISYSGLRTGEASHLRWRDWERKEDAKGNGYALLIIRGEEQGARKTGPRRAVGLDKANEILAERKQRTEYTSPDDYVFAHPSSARALLRGKPIATFKKSFERALEESELLFDATGNKRTLYTLRHTFATFRLTDGVNVFQLAKTMGNSVQVVEKYYAHSVPEDFASEIARIRTD
jgi:integrase